MQFQVEEDKDAAWDPREVFPEAFERQDDGPCPVCEMQAECKGGRIEKCPFED